MALAAVAKAKMPFSTPDTVAALMVMGALAPAVSARASMPEWPPATLPVVVTDTGLLPKAHT